MYETTAAELLMLIGDKVVQVHERDKEIKALREELVKLRLENTKLQEEITQPRLLEKQ